MLTLLRQFRKNAVLMRTQVGLLQGKRMAAGRDSGLSRVFVDEAAALAFLAEP